MIKRFWNWLRTPGRVPPFSPRPCAYCGCAYVGNFWRIEPIYNGVQPQTLMPLCEEHRLAVAEHNQRLIERGLAVEPQ